VAVEAAPSPSLDTLPEQLIQEDDTLPIPPIRELVIVLEKLPQNLNLEEHVEKLRDHEIENMSSTAVKNPQRRRGRSLSRVGNQLQDINSNIVTKATRRSRRDTSVPLKFTDFEKSDKLRLPRAPSVAKPVTPPTNKRSRRSRETVTPPSKKARLESPKLTETEQIIKYKIMPCSVVIEPFKIAANKPKVANKRVVRKQTLKVKVTPPKKEKNTKTKALPKKKRTSATFPMPIGCKEEPEDIAAVVIQEIPDDVMNESAESSIIAVQSSCESSTKTLTQGN
jgi:hypothetical protein